jgi:hypothetical protein
MSTGSAKVPQARESQRVLDDYHELMLVGLLLNQPDMYLREICHYINATNRVSVSEPTICRILKKHGLTKKNIMQLLFRNVQSCVVNLWQRCPF